MPGLVDDDNRHVGRDGVEIVAGGVAQLGELGVVVAEAEDQVARRHRLGVGGGPVAQGLLQRRDVRDLAVWRGEQVGRQRLQAAHEDVAVGVEEARQERTAREIDHLGVRTAVGHHRFRVTDGEDAAVLPGHRLGAHGGVVHG